MQLKIRKTSKLPPFIIPEGQGNDAPILSRTHLISIGDNFSINLNNALSTLQGLENLSSIGNSLYITGNPQLTDLNGLQNLNSIHDYLRVNDNAQLSECAIFAVCDYLYQQLDTAAFQNNAQGCNTYDEVKSRCSAYPVVVNVQNQYGPIPNVTVLLSSQNQNWLRPTDAHAH